MKLDIVFFNFHFPQVVGFCSIDRKSGEDLAAESGFGFWDRRVQSVTYLVLPARFCQRGYTNHLRLKTSSSLVCTYVRTKLCHASPLKNYVFLLILQLIHHRKDLAMMQYTCKYSLSLMSYCQVLAHKVMTLPRKLSNIEEEHDRSPYATIRSFPVPWGYISSRASKVLQLANRSWEFQRKELLLEPNTV